MWYSTCKYVYFSLIAFILRMQQVNRFHTGCPQITITQLCLFLTVAISCSSSIVHYGLSLNVVKLDINLYLTVLVNAVAEMPAFFLTAILLDEYGRKPLAIGNGTQWFSGLFCLAGSIMARNGPWKVVRMVCGVLGIVLRMILF